MGTAMVSGIITGLGNLRKGVSEPATHANKGWTYHILERWFRPNFQSNRRVKKLSDTNFISSRHVKREKASSLKNVFCPRSRPSFLVRAVGARRGYLANDISEFSPTRAPTGPGLSVRPLKEESAFLAIEWNNFFIKNAHKISRILPGFICKNNRFSACF